MILPFATAVPQSRSSRGPVSDLVEAGHLSAAALAKAEDRARQSDVPLSRILQITSAIPETVLSRREARQVRTGWLEHPVADPDALDRLGAARCLRDRVLPLTPAGAITPVATDRPQNFESARPWLESALGPVAMTITPESAFNLAIEGPRRRAIAAAAETRCPEKESTRGIGTRLPRLVLCVLAALATATVVAPQAVGLAAMALAILILLVNLVLLGIAVYRPVSMEEDAARPIRRPVVSVLVPLFQERDIAGMLLERLSRIDYPRECLQILLIVEDRDRITREALAETELPLWVEVVRVGTGLLQTKPRAMNVALNRCVGSIVGIYDAEDAPDPGQIEAVVRRFAAAPSDVACLQGRLDFYNARANWLTRCFTMEYVVWFTAVLPIFARIGWPVPLGGTTVFLRRDALETVGAWDAHNVTEDADLGMRLARAGWRTELLPETTLEEATCSPRAWIKQRSRWQKGYALTWAAHSQHPRSLCRDLGLWGAVGMQFLFLGSLGATLLAPILWSCWLMMLGLPHPIEVLPPGPRLMVFLGLALITVVEIVLMGIVLDRAGKRYLIAGFPLRILYVPLATLALFKALWELVACPYFWDKTAHGVSPPDEPFNPRTAPLRT